MKSLVERALELRPLIEKASQSLSDVDAISAPELFPEWKPDSFEYVKDTRVQYFGMLYKCLQSHKSQSSWNPKDSASLWVRVDSPTQEWPEWRQPAGGHDAYSKGYKVSHKTKHWISDVDNNVWEPGVYGWTQQ